MTKVLDLKHKNLSLEDAYREACVIIAAQNQHVCPRNFTFIFDKPMHETLPDIDWLEKCKECIIYKEQEDISCCLGCWEWFFEECIRKGRTPFMDAVAWGKLDL